MYLGAMVELAESAELYKNPLHPYTKALLSAIPIPDPEKEHSKEVIPLEGDVPSPVNVPSGCKFVDRCPLAEARCGTDVPVFEEKQPGHFVACHLVEKQS